VEGAAHSVIIARCRHVYIHELRGVLNPINLAVELLSRAASAAAKNPAMLEQSSMLAKRAMSIHDKSTVELFKQIMIADDPPGTVNLGTMLEEILRLFAPDRDLKAIAFQFTKGADVVVQAPAFKLRLFLMGLIAMTIDELSERAEFSLVLTRGEGAALIELSVNIDLPRVDTPEMLLATGIADSMTPYALVLAALRHWFGAGGGGLEIRQSVPARMRIHYPLWTTQPTPSMT